MLTSLSDVLANITLAHPDAVGRGIHSISSQWQSTDAQKNRRVLVFSNPWLQHRPTQKKNSVMLSLTRPRYTTISAANIYFLQIHRHYVEWEVETDPQLLLFSSLAWVPMLRELARLMLARAPYITKGGTIYQNIKSPLVGPAL